MTKGARTPDGRVRWTCKGGRAEGRAYCYSTTAPKPGAVRTPSGRVIQKGKAKPPIFRRPIASGSRVFVVTSAQNATPVHQEFWACLTTIAQARGAELMVVPVRYKNPTSRWTESQANEETWAAEVQPYLWNVRRAFNDNLMLLGDIKIQPTASDPLTGFDAISGGSSAILGHTKLALRSIATPSHKMAKILTTTGACTVPNYTDSKAGKVGEFHHTLSAVIVEREKGGRFHLRQLHYDKKTATVTDLDKRYHVDHVEKAPAPLAISMGDTHVDFIDPAVERATFGPGGMVETLQPDYLLWNDLLDGYSINPHHAGNPFNKIAKGLNDRSSVADEVRRACEFVRARTKGKTISVVVPSNHDDFLRRWILTHDWKTDPENAEFYLGLALDMVKGTKLTARGTETPSPFPLVFRRSVDMTNIKILHGDESFALAGVELSMHGDRGPNGARGSIRNLRRIGVKSVIGHSHSPGIDEGCVQTGTSTYLRLEYNGGPSSWLNAHVVLHRDGKRQLIIIVDGRWRAAA